LLGLAKSNGKNGRKQVRSLRSEWKAKKSKSKGESVRWFEAEG